MSYAPRRPWTSDEDLALTASWARPDVSIPKIGEQLDRSSEAVEYRGREVLLLGPKPTLDFGWPAESVDRLKAMWRGNMSSRAIATALGNGLTKNGVIGKARRLGLEERSPPKPGPKPKKAPKPLRDVSLVTRLAHRKRERAGGTGVFAPAPQDRMQRLASAVLPGAQPKVLAELEPHQCKWSVGPVPPQGEGDRMLFCADPTAEGESYCAHHKRRNFAATRSPEQIASDTAKAAKMREGKGPGLFTFAKRRAA